jgi:hypothetical protein
MTETDRFSAAAPDDVEGHSRNYVDPQAGADDVEGHTPRI